MAQLPYKNYNQTKIQTSDQLSLIILLYDGLSRFLRKGQRKIVEKDYEGAHHYPVSYTHLTLPTTPYV